MTVIDHDDPLITVGMKVMFYYRAGWFVGDIFDAERERYLIERQVRGHGITAIMDR